MRKVLEARELTVRYGAFTAAENISFSLKPGDWLMLAGPNGAGKTTVLSALSQAVPYTGRVTLRGQDIRRFSPAALAREMGVLSQRHQAAYAYTVEEIVELGRYAHQRGFLLHRDEGGRDAMERALRLTGLDEMRDKSALTLSGGELQRVFLAQVFAQDPRILLLDEPANHLDLKYQRQLFDLIDAWRQEENRAVISVVHDLSLARRYGTRALIMHRGRCAAQGDPRETFSPRLLSEVYEMDVYGWMNALAEPWRGTGREELTQDERGG